MYKYELSEAKKAFEKEKKRGTSVQDITKNDEYRCTVFTKNSIENSNQRLKNCFKNMKMFSGRYTCKKTDKKTSGQWRSRLKKMFGSHMNSISIICI